MRQIFSQCYRLNLKGHLAITDRYPELNVKHTLVALAYAASTQATSGISVACNIQPRPTGQLLLGHLVSSIRLIQL